MFIQSLEYQNVVLKEDLLQVLEKEVPFEPISHFSSVMEQQECYWAPRSVIQK